MPQPGMSDTDRDVTLQLTADEAEWLGDTLGLVMRIARHWDNLTATDVDYGNAISAKLTRGRLEAGSVE